MPAPLPEVELCSAAALPDEAQRAAEDELLANLQAMRAAGGVTCGDSPSSTALPPLRLDTRLLCAARVLAADIALTGALSLVDSQGRNSRDRMNLAGYAASSWAESLELKASSAADALSRMLADASVCAQLTDSRYQDVGIGNSGGAYVVTLAAE